MSSLGTPVATNDLLATAPIRVKSPLSDVIIIEYDPATKQTTKRLCAACRAYIESNEYVLYTAPFFDHGVGDPLYFIAAGVEFETMVVPRFGTIAWCNPDALRRFLRRFSYDDKRTWRKETGMPFPYEYFNDLKRPTKR